MMVNVWRSKYNSANDLFNRVCFRSRLYHWLRSLVGIACDLKFLDMSLDIKTVSTIEKTVSLAAIREATARPIALIANFAQEINGTENAG